MKNNIKYKNILKFQEEILFSNIKRSHINVKPSGILKLGISPWACGSKVNFPLPSTCTLAHTKVNMEVRLSEDRPVTSLVCKPCKRPFNMTRHSHTDPLVHQTQAPKALIVVHIRSKAFLLHNYGQIPHGL